MAFFRKRSSKRNDGGDLDQFIADYEVPSFPGAISDVLRMIRQEESSNADIAQNLEADPGMSVSVLRLVNSASFGLRQRVDDVCQAVNLVGRSSLESILISLAMKEIVPMKPRPGFDAAAFWRAALQRASVAGRMAVKLSPPDRSLCWTAALLQDIAIPMLVDQMSDRYCAILETWSEGHEELSSLEIEELGFDHAEAGQRVCESWELPERLTEAIAEHHLPPTLETAPVRLVSFVRPGVQGPDGEVPGQLEMISAAAGIGLDPETSLSQIRDGLVDAEEMNTFF